MAVASNSIAPREYDLNVAQVAVRVPVKAAGTLQYSLPGEGRAKTAGAALVDLRFFARPVVTLLPNALSFAYE